MPRTTKVQILIVVILSLSMLGLNIPPIRAEAGYIYSGYHWNKHPGETISYILNDRGSSDIPDFTEFDAVRAAFQVWQDDGASFVDFYYQGLFPYEPLYRDTYSVVGWVDLDPGQGISRTDVYLTDGVIVECDIVFNDYYLWTTTGVPGGYDVQNVATHEIGHFLELGNLYTPEYVGQTMYGHAGQGETNKRSLEWGDIAGIRYIYPNRFQATEGLGWYSEGGDVALGQINGAGSVDMIAAWVDNPSGGNYIKYRFGWDINPETGAASSWSTTQMALGWVGDETAGLGVALTNLDATPNPEMIVLWVDNPSGANTIYYKIAWNLDNSGTPSSWSNLKVALSNGVGYETQGAAVTFANLDANPNPEMLVCWVDNPSGENTIYYMVGWNVNSSGDPASWSTKQSKPGWVGPETQGAGTVLVTLCGGNEPDLMLFWIENSGGANHGWYQVGLDVNSGGTTSLWSDKRAIPGDWEWVGDTSAGCGVATAQVSLTTRPELVFLWIDDPPFENWFDYRFQWETLPNRPPQRASKPSGPGGGVIYEPNVYTTSTTDPEGDPVRYTFDWGDSTNTTTAYYASGATASASHYWTSVGTYNIKVLAQDASGAYAQQPTLEGYYWSEILTVVIGTGQGCPILSVFDGSQYLVQGLMDLYNPNGIDLTKNRILSRIPTNVNGVYKLRLTEHPQTRSTIDQVKLYAILEGNRLIELQLIRAWHSEYGNVLPQLLLSDNIKTSMLGANHNNGTSQSIDLEFSATQSSLEVIGFSFQIEGNVPDKKEP